MRSIKEQLDPIFYPKSLAVIGASNNALKWGWIILHNILRNRYRGRLYPVNRSEDKIIGVKAYHSVGALPEPVDLALVVIPAHSVAEAVEECAKSGVKGCVVITSGFKESGEDGAALEKELVGVARKAGIRIVGPNCMGVLSSTVSLVAVMSLIDLRPGPISFISQSGNLGTLAMWNAMQMGVGFSKFVSTGNEADLHCEDYIEYFGQDSDTSVIACYMEGFSDARRFMRTAHEVAERKPVVVLKGGVTQAGSRAARAHSGSLAGTENIFTAAFKQAGVLKAESEDELVDYAGALASQPLPKSNRVGILSLGGGWGVLASDSCEKHGLIVPPLPPIAVSRIDKVLPPYWSKGNPVDTVAKFDAATLRVCIETLLELEAIDSIIIAGFGTYSYFASEISGSAFATKEQAELFDQISMIEGQIAKDIVDSRKKYGKPIMVVSRLSGRESSSIQILESEGMPPYPTPQRAAKALSKLVQYRRFIDSSREPRNMNHREWVPGN
ncbi:MAG: CoA-binding protein [Promethearchaeati archaeon SRVP18_Atabeyarchaeia-1]